MEDLCFQLILTLIKETVDSKEEIKENVTEENEQTISEDDKKISKDFIKEISFPENSILKTVEIKEEKTNNTKEDKH